MSSGELNVRTLFFFLPPVAHFCTSLVVAADKKSISIDPQYPGNQGEGIFAPRFWGYEKDGFVYSGVTIEILVDLRDVEESLYALKFIDGTNIATMTVPILPATFRKHKRQHEARIAADDVSKKSHDALRSAHSKMAKDEQQLKLKLVFPPEWKLTQRPFVSAAAMNMEKGISEKVKPKLVSYKVDTSHKDSGGNTIYQLFGRLTWKLCDAATATPLTEAEADGGADTVTDGLAGL